jgi:multiple sugar transport system permease protein
MAMRQTASSPAPRRRHGWRGGLERNASVLFLAPAIVYLVLVSIYPLVYSLYLSLRQRTLTEPGNGLFIGLKNFSDLFHDGLFHKALLNTFLVTAVSVALELIIAFAVAHVFAALAESRTAQVLRTVFILPMMLTPVVSGLLWSYILNPTLGIANYLLEYLHLPPFDWFSSSTTALPTLILVNVWQWGPFLMLITMAGLLSIPREHYEAARLEGARWHHIVRFIELPALRGVLFIGGILRVVDNFRLFDVVYAATKGGPGDSTEVVSMFAYRQMFNFFNVGYGSATTVAILVIATVLVALASRLLLREEAA